MIDIHAHILPGIDDGAKTIDESLAMCRIAVSDGIDAIAATPHTHNGMFNNAREDIIAKVNELNALLKANKINLTIYPGADVRIYPGILSDIEEGTLLTLNDTRRYFLLEMPFQSIPLMAMNTISRLINKGITPIITHPERNEQIIRQFGIAEQFKEKGALLQLTAMSITGGFGEQIQDFSARMLKEGLVDIIASDAHSPDRRPPVLSQAVSVASGIVGSDVARRMVDDVPCRILRATDM